MTKKLLAISLTLFLVSASELAFAKHEMRDRSSVNSSREANSNGRDAEDRDKGQDRAEDRRSDEGAEHQNADGEKHEGDDDKAQANAEKRDSGKQKGRKGRHGKHHSDQPVAAPSPSSN